MRETVGNRSFSLGNHGQPMNIRQPPGLSWATRQPINYLQTTPLNNGIIQPSRSILVRLRNPMAPVQQDEVARLNVELNKLKGQLELVEKQLLQAQEKLADASGKVKFKEYLLEAEAQKVKDLEKVVFETKAKEAAAAKKLSLVKTTTTPTTETVKAVYDENQQLKKSIEDLKNELAEEKFKNQEAIVDDELLIQKDGEVTILKEKVQEKEDALMKAQNELKEKEGALDKVEKELDSLIAEFPEGVSSAAALTAWAWAIKENARLAAYHAELVATSAQTLTKAKAKLGLAKLHESAQREGDVSIVYDPQSDRHSTEGGAKLLIDDSEGHGPIEGTPTALIRRKPGPRSAVVVPALAGGDVVATPTTSRAIPLSAAREQPTIAPPAPLGEVPPVEYFSHFWVEVLPAHLAVGQGPTPRGRIQFFCPWNGCNSTSVEAHKVRAHYQKHIKEVAEEKKRKKEGKGKEKMEKEKRAKKMKEMEKEKEKKKTIFSSSDED